MTEKKKDPRPKWSSKKYKNYGEFNKAVLNWRERNNKNYKWNKKDVVWEVRDGKRVPVDRNTQKVLKFQERGIPGFVQDHINPKVIEFSNKPFGFDYANLRGSKVYDENLGRFLTEGELKKENKMRAEGKRIDEGEGTLSDYEMNLFSGENPTDELKVNKKKKKEEKKNNYANEGGGNEAGGSENKNNDGGAGAAAFGGGDENNNYPSITDMGSNKAQNNETKSADNVGPRERLTARERMRAQNVERFGEEHVSLLQERDKAFQAAKGGGKEAMAEFREDYGPNLGSFLRDKKSEALKIDKKKPKKKVKK